MSLRNAHIDSSVSNCLFVWTTKHCPRSEEEKQTEKKQENQKQNRTKNESYSNLCILNSKS